MTIDAVVGHDQFEDGALPAQCLRGGLATLGEEETSRLAFLSTQQPASIPQHALRGGGKINRLEPAHERCTDPGQRCLGRQFDPQAAVASAAGTFALATSTSPAKAAGSVTARSARILRSTSIPAALRPEMKRLYVIPSARAAALIRWIHNLRKSLLRARRSR